MCVCDHGQSELRSNSNLPMRASVSGCGSGQADNVDRHPGNWRTERLRAIISAKGFVSVAGAAREFGVSEMTIRRDLARLETEGAALRTHGGAVAPTGTSSKLVDLVEPAFDGRARLNADAKRAIAACAARIPQPHQTVGLDVGSTALELARRLDSRAELRIFTNSLRAAIQLSDTAHQVYVPGGQVRGTENSVCGTSAIKWLRNYWLDHVFIGVSGITEDGCFDYSLEETEIKHVFIERASNVVVLCDSSKFGRLSLVQVSDLQSIDTLITDAQPPASLGEALHAATVQVVIARPGGCDTITAEA